GAFRRGRGRSRWWRSTRWRRGRSPRRGSSWGRRGCTPRHDGGMIGGGVQNRPLMSDDRGGAAVHVDGGTGGEAGELGAEEAGHGGEFLRLADAAERDVGAELRGEGLVGV